MNTADWNLFGELMKTVGFPSLVSLIVLLRLEPVMKGMLAEQTKQTEILRELIKK